MVSLINKQILLTAYAYLFIMEQQKAQQGGEALQLQVESIEKTEADELLKTYEWRKERCRGVKNHAEMKQWLAEHEVAWEGATSVLDKRQVLAEMKEDFVEAINSVPRLEKRYAALVEAARSWGCTLGELIAEGRGLGNIQVNKDGLPTMQQNGETDGGLAEEWRRSLVAKSQDVRRTNTRITYNSIGSENLSPYLEKVKILELMQLAMLEKLWKHGAVENGIVKLSKTGSGSYRAIPEKFTEYKKYLRNYLPGQIELMKTFIEGLPELRTALTAQVRTALHFATHGQEEQSCRVCHGQIASTNE